MTTHRSLLVRTSVFFIIVASTWRSSAPQNRTHAGLEPNSQTTRAKPKPSADAISFADVTRAAGIDSHLTCGSPEKRYIMETMCGGVAIFDYDNDGWMDIYFVNGSTLEDLKIHRCHSGKLYRNNHDGTFADVTARSGLDHCRWGFGVAVGDYDNDGWEDLYLTYLDGGV